MLPSLFSPISPTLALDSIIPGLKAHSEFIYILQISWSTAQQTGSQFSTNNANNMDILNQR
jgi:hypothetical protein